MTTITSPHSPSGEVTLAIAWIVTTLSLSLIIARLYLRLRINRQKLLLGDVLICLAWLSAMVGQCMSIVLFQMHVLRKDVDPFLNGFHGNKKTFQRALKYFWVHNVPFFTSFYLSKATLLALYWQIIPEFLKTSRRLLYATIIYCCCAYTTSMLLQFFLCFPIQRNWVLGPNVCIYQPGKVFTSAWAMNFLGDLLIFTLPFSFLHILNIKGAVRVGVYCTFGLGVINMAFSMTRLLSIKLLPRNSKGTISITIIELWSSLDVLVGVIIANLPSLAPYLRMMRKREPERFPGTCNNAPVRKHNTLDKYKCGPRDEEWGTSGISGTSSTLQNSEWASEGGKKTRKDSSEDVGVLPPTGTTGSGSRGGDSCDEIKLEHIGGARAASK